MACGKEIKKVYGVRESDERDGDGGKGKAGIGRLRIGSFCGVINTAIGEGKGKFKFHFPLKISVLEIFANFRWKSGSVSMSRNMIR